MTTARIKAAALSCLLLAGYGPASGAQTPDLDAFHRQWQTYATESSAAGLQPGCAPRRYPPPPGTARRGVVIAYHGFSACPQQFEQLAPALAALGFEVLVPRLPGHGLATGEDGAENLSALPTVKSWARDFGGLAERMNRIMALAPGEHLLLGYSLGGSLAINAAHRAPGEYRRLLLIAPLVAVHGGAAIERIADLLGRVPGLRNLHVKPAALRRQCAAWATAGRAGFCGYRYRHVPALLLLERQNRDWQARRPLHLPIQVVLGDDDHIVSNPAVMALAAAQRPQAPVAVCVLAGGVPHELLTPYENVGRPMHWLPRLTEITTGFIAGGRLVDCPAAQ